MSAHGTQPTRVQASGTIHPSPEDLALYAMQLFSLTETAELTEHLARCPQCREGLARLHDDLAAYALTAESLTPPVTARERLLAQVAREKKVVFSVGQSRSIDQDKTERKNLAAAPAAAASATPPQPETSHPKPPPSRAAITWSGWALAACLGIMAGFLYLSHRELNDRLAEREGELLRLNKDAASSHQLLDALTDPQAMRVTLTPGSKTLNGPLGGVTYNAEKGKLVFLASNLDPVRSYKTYELWIVPVDGSPPVPAGTFHPDDHGGASVILPDIPKGVAAKSFGVTIENVGGSLKPTPPIVLAGS